MKRRRWIVEDWAGNRLFPELDFATFGAGWAHVYIHSPEDCWEDIFVEQAPQI